jgi:hypothetical protein
MTKIVEFKIPKSDGTTDMARGRPIWLMIGERKIKFIFQRDDEGHPHWLTHFASGYKFGSLDDAICEIICTLSPYHKFTHKQLAEFLVNKIVNKVGVKKVLMSIDSAPVINGKE